VESWADGVADSFRAFSDIIVGSWPHVELNARQSFRLLPRKQGALVDGDAVLWGVPGLSPLQQRTQLAVWALMRGPLFISGTNGPITEDVRSLLAIHQDPTGGSGFEVAASGADAYGAYLQNGSAAVLLVNYGDSETAARFGDGAAVRLEPYGSALLMLPSAAVRPARPALGGTDCGVCCRLNLWLSLGAVRVILAGKCAQLVQSACGQRADRLPQQHRAEAAPFVLRAHAHCLRGDKS
jgi:hypothetical protein